MPNLDDRLRCSVDLDAIIENGITNTAGDEPYFVKAQEKKIMEELLQYTKKVLQSDAPNPDNEAEIIESIDKQSGDLLDVICETSHIYIKNGMRLGAHLLLQLLNLE